MNQKLMHIPLTGILCLMLCLGSLFLISCEDSQKTDPKTADSANPTKSPANEPKTGDESPSEGEKILLFYGNSLTAGYGLDEEKSFPSLIQNRIDSLGLGFNVVNAGLSGETTAGGLGRIDWVLKQSIDIFVLELGGNDVLRGLDLKQTESNLRGIIEKVRAKGPEISIILAGMQAPPNMGTDYTTEFAGIFPKLAKEMDTGLIPFLLDGVGGDPKLNLPDGIHPNEEGQKIVRENVWEVLEGYLMAG